MLKTLCILITFLFSPALGATEPTVDAELQQSLAAFFAAKPTLHGASAELVNVQRWPNIQGKVRWSLPTLRFLPKRVSLIAEQGHGKHKRRWYVPVHVKWMKNVITLKHNVSARSMLDRSMLIKQRKNIAGLRGQVWSDAADVEGLQTLRSLQKGSVVVSSYVKRPPLIQRGDIVTILVEVAGIKVRAEGVALKSGRKGDRMLVKNIRSNQTVHSIVQDAHTVAVHIGGV